MLANREMGQDCRDVPAREPAIAGAIKRADVQAGEGAEPKRAVDPPDVDPEIAGSGGADEAGGLGAELPFRGSSDKQRIHLGPRRVLLGRAILRHVGSTESIVAERRPPERPAPQRGLGVPNDIRHGDPEDPLRVGREPAEHTDVGGAVEPLEAVIVSCDRPPGRQERAQRCPVARRKEMPKRRAREAPEGCARSGDQQDHGSALRIGKWPAGRV